MRWMLVRRADPRAMAIADRHYNRQSVGSPCFAPPGPAKVFLSELGTAAWVTSWPYSQFCKHAWAGAWINSLFRRERNGEEGFGGMEDDHPASEMIRLAVAATRALWPRVPPLGMVTFVDPTEVAATPMRRHRCRINCGERRIYGYSYERAGFAHVGYTAERGLWAWQLLPDDMPEPSAPLFMQHLITFDNVAAHANA